MIKTMISQMIDSAMGIMVLFETVDLPNFYREKTTVVVRNRDVNSDNVHEEWFRVHAAVGGVGSERAVVLIDRAASPLDVEYLRRYGWTDGTFLSEVPRGVSGRNVVFQTIENSLTHMIHYATAALDIVESETRQQKDDFRVGGSMTYLRKQGLVVSSTKTGVYDLWVDGQGFCFSGHLYKMLWVADAGAIDIMDYLTTIEGNLLLAAARPTSRIAIRYGSQLVESASDNPHLLYHRWHEYAAAVALYVTKSGVTPSVLLARSWLDTVGKRYRVIHHGKTVCDQKQEDTDMLSTQIDSDVIIDGRTIILGSARANYTPEEAKLLISTVPVLVLVDGTTVADYLALRDQLLSFDLPRSIGLHAISGIFEGASFSIGEGASLFRIVGDRRVVDHSDPEAKVNQDLIRSLS
jgi:hypothetical protein